MTYLDIYYPNHYQNIGRNPTRDSKSPGQKPALKRFSLYSQNVAHKTKNCHLEKLQVSWLLTIWAPFQRLPKGKKNNMEKNMQYFTAGNSPKTVAFWSPFLYWIGWDPTHRTAEDSTQRNVDMPGQRANTFVKHPCQKSMSHPEIESTPADSEQNIFCLCIYRWGKNT